MPRLCGGEDEAQAPVPARAHRDRAPSAEGRVDPTRELIAGVIEFLQYHGYEATLETFSSERKRIKRDGGGGSTRASADDGGKRSGAKLTEAFDSGSREEFFSLWERIVPAQLLFRDLDTAKLEFYLQIYFAVFPFLPASKAAAAKPREDTPRRMEAFKEFLETRGAELAQTGEFLPFYALPYVESPRGHPSFKPLLRSAWAKELRAQLELFLKMAPISAAKPRLYGWLAASRGGGGNSLQPPAEGTQRHSSARPSGSREDLASRGIMSLVPEGGGAGRQGQGAAPPGPGDTLSALPGILKQSLRLEQADGAPETRSAFQQAILPPLDYARIAEDLGGAENSEVSGLLQALRWRISKSPAGNDRLRVVMTFVEQDVLRCSSSSSSSRHGASASLVETMAARTDGPVAEELARLVNCMASTAAGRAYLLQPGSGTAATLVQLLTAIPSMDTLNAPMILAHEGIGHMASDSLLQQHALGALQKLSLLRRAQTEMIGLGLIPSLVALLQEELEGLSEYTVEYGMALLMNLSLRSAGKKCCEECDVLALLDALIESSNPQVRTYANGMLYSVLHREAIRDAARERGLGDFLQMVAANSEEVFARQIRYIQMQLGSEVSDRDDAPSGDEEEFEDIDEEGEDVDGDEADEYEATEHLLPKGTLRGEELLCQGYLADIVAAEQEEVMMRESMDIALATMNMAKHMQGGSLGASMRSSAVFASLAGEVLQRPATPLTFNASIRSNAAAIEPPLERSATSHERRHQPPSSSQHRRTASASSSGPRGSDRDLRNRDRERDRERGDTSRAEGKAIATSSSSSVSRAEKSGERSNRSSSSSSRRPPSSSLPSQAPPRRSSNAEPTSSRSHVRTPDSEALLRHPKPASRSGLGSSSRSRRVSGTDTAARAEQEVAARRTKNASELRRDDPGGYQGKERATQDHMQAFGKGQEIPRTPSTRGSQR